MDENPAIVSGGNVARPEQQTRRCDNTSSYVVFDVTSEIVIEWKLPHSPTHQPAASGRP